MQQSDLAARGALRHQGRHLQLLQELERLRKEQCADLRELDFALGPLEEVNAELLFELPDLPAQRRLRHAQALGRPREVQLFGDSDEKIRVAESS